VFFQACFGASPIRSAVDFLPGAMLASPFGFVAGLTIMIAKKYRVVNWAAWAISMIACGLISTFKEDTPVGKWVGYQLIAALGIGALVSGLVLRPTQQFIYASNAVCCPSISTVGAVTEHPCCIRSCAIRLHSNLCSDMGHHHLEHNIASTLERRRSVWLEILTVRRTRW
jgi:hypothetical protein